MRFLLRRTAFNAFIHRVGPFGKAILQCHLTCDFHYFHLPRTQSKNRSLRETLIVYIFFSSLINNPFFLFILIY